MSVESSRGALGGSIRAGANAEIPRNSAEVLPQHPETVNMKT
jgi:hypothetical protein